MSYQYVLTFIGPCTLISNISVVDATLSNLTATKAIRPAVGSGASSVWVSSVAIPPISRPFVSVQEPVTFSFQELVNGVQQLVNYPGTVDYGTNGIITLTCNHPYVASRYCGWQGFNFDFTRV
jgi:hypothetical protein